MKPATVKESPTSSITRKITLLTVAFIACVSVVEAAVSRGFDHLLDAVVRIDVREESFDTGARRFTGSIGSGVIVSADGLILTNAHVASPRSVELSVTLASLERVNATLVGWDHWTDLALLRIDLAEVKRRGLKFTHAEFTDSDKLYPGQTVYAVGTPHGLTRTVTRGIISNNRRFFADNRGVKGYETGLFNTWLQTDAAINPGNSGGPLVDEKGRVVGINSRGYLGADNLAFAIPANIAKRVVAGLSADGAITRSYIGIVPGALLDLEGFYSLKQNTGLLINSVDPGSPAAKAGLRGGDIVLSINGVPVDGRFPEQLPPILNIIASLPVGSPVKLVVKRGEQTTTPALVTEKLESRQGEEWAFEKWGLTVRKVSRAYARENQLDDDTGLLVIGVQPGFPAAVAGLERGDIITKINQERIASLDVAKAKHDDFVAKPAPTLIEAVSDRRVSLYILKP
ncbi:trypsin-like peptidase domain-containing protein [Rariglobus hedericola]|uniref:PDZ domain-containing protein n=1 Tax=Rariglobus hedericola TaxID=2597822 RepID=A0A556QNY7_9BACT|nr:trypsin-like peptidase domain-containing protein [Rariglobus hedericola]TSJ78366.1 PDZ domain-containing protein [Rariglobus hedericola]